MFGDIATPKTGCGGLFYLILTRKTFQMYEKKCIIKQNTCKNHASKLIPIFINTPFHGELLC